MTTTATKKPAPAAALPPGGRICTACGGVNAPGRREVTFDAGFEHCDSCAGKETPPTERIEPAAAPPKPGIPDPSDLIAACRTCQALRGEQCRWSDPNDLPRRQMHRARRDDIAALRAAGVQRTPAAELIPPVNGQLELALAAIDPGVTNPRSSPGDLSGLAASILTHGVLQPLVVRPAADGIGYSLVAGSRRLGAATEAGLTAVPVVVRPATDDRAAILLALAENADREPLNPIDEAVAFRRLMALGMSQVEIGAARGGKAQETVSNAIRLLSLPADVQDRIAAGELSAAHGVALARKELDGFPAVQSELARLAVEQQAPAKALARGLFFSPDLERAGAVRSLMYPKFDRSCCLECPHGAFLKGGGGFFGWCLLPAEFDRKQAEAEAANTAALELAREQAKAARRAPTGTVGEQPKADEDTDTGLPNLTDLPAGSVAEIWGARPSGCSELCLCNLEVVGRDGKLTAVCTDPERYRRLSDEQRARETAERQAEVDSDLSGLVAVMDSFQPEEVSSRLMALAVVTSFRDLPPAVIEGAAERLGLTVNAGAILVRDLVNHSAALSELARLPPGRIGALGLLARFQQEAAAYVSYKRPRALWSWWSGDGGQASDLPDQTEPPQADDEPGACHECGGSIPASVLDGDSGAGGLLYETDQAGNFRDEEGYVLRIEDGKTFCPECARRLGVFQEPEA